MKIDIKDLLKQKKRIMIMNMKKFLLLFIGYGNVDTDPQRININTQEIQNINNTEINQINYKMLSFILLGSTNAVEKKKYYDISNKSFYPLCYFFSGLLFMVILNFFLPEVTLFFTKKYFFVFFGVIFVLFSFFFFYLRQHFQSVFKIFHITSFVCTKKQQNFILLCFFVFCFCFFLFFAVLLFTLTNILIFFLRIFL